MEFHATLVIMAAGMGSRFGGLKQAEPVGKDGQAIVDYSVYDAVEAGFDKVVFIIKKAIEKDFKELVGNRIEKMVRVEYVFQENDKLPEGYTCPPDRVKPWGTGHAILCCKGVVNEPFAVINADDYYGKSCFKTIYEELKKQTGEYAMVGFQLKNTVTENGTVSRGICEVKDGWLEKVTEYTKIDAEGKSYNDKGEYECDLDPDGLVSMNLWGFVPDIFDYLEEDFKEFLDERISEPKSEFFIPFEVDRLVSAGIKKVRVLASEDRWYGVTYREDKQSVVDAIAEMTAKGLYK